MQISNILKLMDFMGVGVGIEEEIFLTYLNQAHYELYNHTASLNDDLVINETIQTVVNESSIKLSNEQFCVRAIYSNLSNFPLTQLDIIKFTEYKKNISAGNPRIFNAKKNVIDLYPVLSNTVYDIDVLYVPQPAYLTMQTSESDIPYPLSFHNLLADGALYYLFQDEGGFRNSEKSNDHKVKWERGKGLLYSYLFHRSAEITSTYSSVL
jgi:hypothetical protein